MNTTCYLCDSRLVPFLEKAGYVLVRCPKCGMAKTLFHQDYRQFVPAFYCKGYFTGDPKYGAYATYEYDKKFITANFRKQLMQIRKIKPNGRLLDVGSAMGYFVEMSLSYGYDAYGFDPSMYAVSKAPESVKDRLTIGTAQTITYPKQSFDIIVMLDVLEHLDDPIAVLTRLRQFLKPDGIMVFATGDTGSLFAKISGRFWSFYNPPQHLWFFNHDNLMTILAKSGFSQSVWYRIDKWLSLNYVLHLAYSASGFRFAHGMSRLIHVLGLDHVGIFLPLRDNITIIAQRIHTYD